MKGFVKFWVGAFILSMIVYYIPVYLFSNNLTQSVMSLKFEKAAPVAIINALPPGLNNDQVEGKLKELTEKAASSGRFDTDISLEDALKNNPSVKSVELVRGGTPEDYVPAIDPVYHDLDVGLKITFQDGSGLIAIFDAIGKSFLGGHGAKVFHVQAGYRFNPDGHMFLVHGEDTMTGLVLMIFAKDHDALPGLYNHVFGTKVPVGQIAGVPRGSVEDQLRAAIAAPIPSSTTSSSPSAAVQAPAAAPAAASGDTKASAQAPLPDPNSPCVNNWVVAFHKEQPNAPVSEDQITEWQQWCGQGKQAPQS
ncbi:hypothetical protein [Rhodanobacter sp. C01]|uniref:hypothetical protein n=1 Tax=Rhodanobacter sp. C01 TaxID=1945856 RepID=UPI0009843AD7|nr:hypothetical protein [Rhodanobacter sp. C01]